MSAEPFDVEAFYAALDRKRRERRIHWRQVCREADLAASAISRMSLDGALPNVQNLAKLLLWLGDTDLKPYLTALPAVPDEGGEKT